MFGCVDTNIFLLNKSLVFTNIKRIYLFFITKTADTNSVQFIDIANLSSRISKLGENRKVSWKSLRRKSFRLVRLWRPDKYNCKF